MPNSGAKKLIYRAVFYRLFEKELKCYRYCPKKSLNETAAIQRQNNFVTSYLAVIYIPLPLIACSE
jgi:hypothetical protein